MKTRIAAAGADTGLSVSNAYNLATMSAPDKLDLKRVVVLSTRQVPEAGEQAAKIIEFLKARGAEGVHAYLDDEELPKQFEAKAFDLVIVLGGDGTVLRAGHLCALGDLPLLGINLGRFGFLIEVGRDGWPERLNDLFAGNYWLEQRMMLRAKHWRGDKCLDTSEVLNEAVIGRGYSVRPVHLSANLDGQPLATYVADALIVATPTGSTAYALAAGGPILPPELRNILILPVAPHLSVDRAIVLSEGSTVSVTVRSDHQAVLSVDGKPPVDLAQGDRVDVCASEHTLRFVRFQGRGYFYRHLISLMKQNPAAGAN